MNCLETKDLSYHFAGGSMVLNNINLQVPTGSIYGFLGPNGAGKTTTLRLILGLLKKQSGAISIFNLSFDKSRVEILRNIGSLIESPALYAHLTAKENLAVWQKLYQCPASRINEVLGTVGLGDTGNKKAGQFSLGMKQRLSIAVALLHQPKLLVLDEPTNGLDPNGIVEIRELLKKLNRESGMTILISSHLLAEVEKMVTDIGIIHQGKLLYQGPLSRLYDEQAKNAKTVFRTGNQQEAENIFSRCNLRPVFVNDTFVLPEIGDDLIAKLNAQLVGNNIPVYGIKSNQTDLEGIFMNLINN
jgi:ABC-2 type transport system ATP-binding protein